MPRRARCAAQLGAAARRGRPATEPRTPLREQRDKLKLTQEQVAELAGIDATLYSRYERHEVVPPVHRALRILIALGIIAKCNCKAEEPIELPINGAIGCLIDRYFGSGERNKS